MISLILPVIHQKLVPQGHTSLSAARRKEDIKGKSTDEAERGKMAKDSLRRHSQSCGQMNIKKPSVS